MDWFQYDKNLAMKDLNWYLLTEAAVQNNSFSGKLRKVAENNLSLISCHWPAGNNFSVARLWTTSSVLL